MIEQGTDEWKALRLGKVTASRVSDVSVKTKTGYGAGRKNYMAELVVERLTNQPTDFFMSKDMAWGTEQEKFALAEYEMKYSILVDKIDFVNHPTIPMSGASPDGLVGSDGLIEIKCKKTGNHIEDLLGASIDKSHLDQMMWQMACTGRQWVDYVCYDPRIPEGLQMHIKRVKRDDVYIKGMESEVIKFLKELDEQIESLLKLKEKNEQS